MALTRAIRDKLLGKIRGGHDLESACAALNLSPKTVRADEKLAGEIAEAFRTGTAKLRARVLQGALDNNDLRVLSQLLERREQEQGAVSGSAGSPEVLVEEMRRELHDQIEQHRAAKEAHRAAVMGTFTESEKAVIRRFLELEKESLDHAGVPVRAVRPAPIEEMPVSDPGEPLPSSRADCRG